MADNQTSDLGQAIQDVSEKASLLVREEIELAKTEITEKVTKLIKGAVVGVVAGIFAIFGLLYLLHAASWLIWKLLADVNDDNFWIGFAIVAGVMFLLGALAGLIAARFVKKASPPKPQMAIEEAQLIKETVTSPHPGEAQAPTSRPREEVGA
jgi:uncharacterized membrane protein YqjE